MIFNARAVALLVGGTVAVVSTLLLLVFNQITLPQSFTVFFIILLVTGLAVYLFLDKLVFVELEKFRRLLSDTQRSDLESDEFNPSSKLSVVQNIKEDIVSFVETKQKEVDQLKKAETFRREFVADVSHELKTPIFAAQGFVHTLLDGAVNDRTVRLKFLRKAAKSLDGLDLLVQDLLTLSHIETGQIKMHFENLDLYRLTEEVLEQFEGKHNKKNISLRIEAPQKKLFVYGDTQRLRQVLTNLVSNAIKHSFDDGEVVISLKKVKREVEVNIQDFGEGIPIEHQSRIFERFYRVDKSRSREKGGSGLGLAIVKHILENHNTRVEVDSAPGKGSTFSFKLPRTNTEVRTADQMDDQE
jgi:two-component system, OmpR family, phosphate regulon sensor histidine kinase PhoR